MITRKQIYRFLIRKIFKVPEGGIIPNRIRWVGFILFPLRSFFYFNKEIRYRLDRDCFEINGIRLTSDFIDTLAAEMCRKNMFHQFVKVEDGTLHIRTFDVKPLIGTLIFDCSECNGTGMKTINDPHYRTHEDFCGTCYGTGYVDWTTNITRRSENGNKNNNYER